MAITIPLLNGLKRKDLPMLKRNQTNPQEKVINNKYLGVIGGIVNADRNWGVLVEVNC